MKQPDPDLEFAEDMVVAVLLAVAAFLAVNRRLRDWTRRTLESSVRARGH